MRWYFSKTTRLGLSLLISSSVSVGLFLVGTRTNRTFDLSYLIWNLFLAWIPLGISLWLHKILKHQLWSSWSALAVTFIWVVFLPNSFYMISDYIHIQDVSSTNVLYDSVMFTSFIFNGVILGFLSVYTIHLDLLQRVRKMNAHSVIATVFFLCSFAIYLGRDLRWNTWDVLINPGGVIFDVSDRIIHPLRYPQSYSTTLTFFVLLGSLYLVAWQLARSMRYQKVFDDERK